ncbi:MAG: hypothetical protein ABL871_14395 [Terricaulis sp.]
MPREQRYAGFRYELLDSDAFRELSGNAFKLMARLATRFYGNNNGAISMSVREAAAEIGCCINQASKCFKELEDRGFIRTIQRGSFDWKKRHATTWRLTWLDCNDEPATKEFMRPDRGRKVLVNGCMVDAHSGAQKKTTVARDATDSSTP